MGLHPSDKDKEAAFREADRDRSGQIGWEEFCALGKQLRALGAAAWELAPSNRAKSPRGAKQRQALARVRPGARAKARGRGRGRVRP